MQKNPNSNIHCIDVPDMGQGGGPRAKNQNYKFLHGIGVFDLTYYNILKTAAFRHIGTKSKNSDPGFGLKERLNPRRYQYICK